MELQPQAAPGAERLRAEFVVGDHLRFRRRLDHVEVPLEPRSLRDEVGVSRPDADPADLRLGAPEHLATQDARQHLAAEAQSEDRDVGVDGRTHQTGFARHELAGVVVRGELRAERDDEVVVARVRLRILQIDAGVSIGLSGLTLAHAQAAYEGGFRVGGAVYNSGALTVNNCTIRDSSAPNGGIAGGIGATARGFAYRGRTMRERNHAPAS